MLSLSTLSPLPKLSSHSIFTAKTPGSGSSANTNPTASNLVEILRFALPLLLSVGLIITLANAAGEAEANAHCEQYAAATEASKTCKAATEKSSLIGSVGRMKLNSL